MKTENELIAEFMGGVLKKGQYTLPDRPVNQYTDEYGYAQETYDWSVSELLYHKSWDWLMPVVEKIRPLVHKIDTDSTAWRRLSGKSIFAKLEDVYKAVVEFIRWYNSQTS